MVPKKMLEDTLSPYSGRDLGPKTEKSALGIFINSVQCESMARLGFH